jgi:hypothetical protein
VEKKANPRIRSVEIGIKEVRKIKLYPLSIQDQMELSDIVSESFFAFFANEEEEKSNAEILSFALQTVRGNLDRILELIADPEQKVTLKEIDNTQASAIVGEIIDMNYANELLVKNAKSLFEKIQSLFPSRGLHSMFAGNTQGTGSNISSDGATGMAE